MEIGVRIPHFGRQATPEFIKEWCVTAEEVGFGCLWGADHIVMPKETASLYPLGRAPAPLAEDAVSDLMAPNFEILTTLAVVAAMTDHIKIGTAVQILTLRNPVLNARQLATIDRYSGGRLLVGAGVGWLKEEADAMGLPWDQRGRRAEEHIALLRALWTAPDRHVEFHGTYWNLPPMDPEPLPVQRPIPILIGGHTERAMDRAARIGDGWIAAGLSTRRLEELLPQVHEACRRHDRDPLSLPVYCRAAPGVTTLDDARRYAELGVRSLQVNIDDLDVLRRYADEVVCHVA